MRSRKPRGEDEDLTDPTNDPRTQWPKIPKWGSLKKEDKFLVVGLVVLGVLIVIGKFFITWTNAATPDSVFGAFILAFAFGLGLVGWGMKLSIDRGERERKVKGLKT